MAFPDRGSWQQTDRTEDAVAEVRENARDLADAATDLIDYLGDADCVLFGEASHGTSEFYQWRAGLTARLIEAYDVSFVAVEGDWTDCYEINRHVKGEDDRTTRDVLEAFDRWPTWMWAN